MQGRHRVNVQAFKEPTAQKTSGLIQRHCALLWITYQDTKKHLGMGVVWRDLNGLDRDHPHARVFQLARNELRQIPLDLVSNPKPTVRGG